MRWIVLAIVLLIVSVLLLTVHRSRRLQSSLKSGRFETYYTSAIDALQTQTRAVREKLGGNQPGDLEILPEELLRHDKKSKEQLEKQGKTTLENITLRGIYWSDAMPLAEINDRLCKTGDEIMGFTVEKIEPYHILLTDRNGKKHTLSLIKKGGYSSVRSSSNPAKPTKKSDSVQKSTSEMKNDDFTEIPLIRINP